MNAKIKSRSQLSKKKTFRFTDYLRSDLQLADFLLKLILHSKLFLILLRHNMDVPPQIEDNNNIQILDFHPLSFCHLIVII